MGDSITRGKGDGGFVSVEKVGDELFRGSSEGKGTGTLHLVSQCCCALIID
jgi:hypothetical protein